MEEIRLRDFKKGLKIYLNSQYAGEYYIECRLAVPIINTTSYVELMVQRRFFKGEHYKHIIKNDMINVISAEVLKIYHLTEVSNFNNAVTEYGEPVIQHYNSHQEAMFYFNEKIHVKVVDNKLLRKLAQFQLKNL